MWFFIFLASGVFALLHFVWQGIVAPSMRLELRFRIFALRDKLRRLKLADQPLNDEAFTTAEDALIAALRVLYEIDIPLLVHCDSLVAADQKFKEQVQKRMEIIKCSNSSELEDIMNDLRKQVERAAVINSGGWILYVLPPVFMFLFFKRLFSPIFSVIYMNRAQINKIVPEREEDLVFEEIEGSNRTFATQNTNKPIVRFDP
jgi:hypothetical protein